MELHQQDALTTLKAIIYGYQRVPLSVIQQCFLIDYDDVPILVAQLQKQGLLQALDRNGQYAIHWQHPDWQNMASRRDLWQSWADDATHSSYNVKKKASNGVLFVRFMGTPRLLLILRVKTKVLFGYGRISNNVLKRLTAANTRHIRRQRRLCAKHRQHLL